jgi:two-component system KDP operon response regulator KdpE
VLARHSESIVTHSTLLKDVWGPNREDSGSLRVYIGSLRRKLEADPSRPKHIVTELGLGYRLLLDPLAAVEGSVE